MNEVHHGTMELPLIVGVDGSEPSLRAVDWAADEAALRGVPLRLVHASLWERYEGTAPAEDLGEPSEQVLADGIVGGAARRARTRQPDLQVSTEVLPEEPEYALVREGTHASALVLGPGGAAVPPSSCPVPSAWPWPPTPPAR
jgi:nucleotide-binding universal stress UspA family protein